LLTDNPGIGEALLSVYLSRPNHIAIAGVRDPENISSKSLNSLPTGSGSKLLGVKIESGSETDAKSAIALLQSSHQVTHFDFVLANAAIENFWGKIVDVAIESMLEHYKIDTIAPLFLFQATLPLLNAATKLKFVIISSGGASITIMDQLPVDTTPYCCSKAAANYLAKINCEPPDLIAFPLDPGWLETDMGLEVAKHVPPVLELPMGSLEAGVKVSLRDPMA
jgi:norsolorinic acid ketoreductase